MYVYIVVMLSMCARDQWTGIIMFSNQITIGNGADRSN